MLKLVYWLYVATWQLLHLPARLLARCGWRVVFFDDDRPQRVSPLAFIEFVHEYRREALTAVWLLVGLVVFAVFMSEMLLNRVQIMEMTTGLTPETMTLPQ